ncbi:MAG: SDR family oxidoreductase [Anaerolineae bacterium]|mgnify:FL=1|nr:SDR family oxidoreductase [Thermoflexales bacterium]HQW35815.1 SDR family oxidoreductase [Thermoflexales bacterium]
MTAGFLPLPSPINCGPSLAGKTAFVTGGLGGIGRACVAALMAHGANVAFTYAEGRESPQDAQNVAALDPARLSAHPLDLRSPDSIRASFGQALERWGRVDILVNNAAVGSATVAAYADDPFEQDAVMMNINAVGALNVCKAFLDAAQETLSLLPRKIINLSSVGGGVQVFPGFRLSDGMSKAAVAFMTRQLAAELAHSRVDVFAICPGATNTGMFQASTLNKMTAQERADFLASLPKGRLIEPAEIANLILFLASEYSTPLHGAVMDASMGLGVRPGLITEHQH